MGRAFNLAIVLTLLAAAGSAPLGAQAADKAGLTTYTNAEYHFSFQYPSRLKPDLSFTTATSWTFLDPGNLNGKSLGFDIYAADNSSEGGGNTKPWFAISQSVRVGISPDVAHCYVPNASMLPTVEAVTINGVDFKVLRADPAAFSAMHTRQDATSYRTIHDAACFAVESVVEEGHDAGSGTSGETPEVAAAVETAAAEADAIIHTFRFTDLPAAAASPVPTRVAFAVGATRGVVTGRIDAGATAGWLVGAAAGQPLLLSVDAPNHDLALSVASVKSHAVLFNTQSTPSPWQALLPDTGDYLVQVHGGAATEDYRLSITTPARIAVGPDAVSAGFSAARSGHTPGGLPVDFVLRLLEGQTVSLALRAGGGAVLRAYSLGRDGTAYLDPSDHRASASFMAGHDEDCIIEVVPTAGADLPFTLDVAIPPGLG